MAVTQVRGATQIKDNTVTSGEVDSTIIIAAGTNAFSGDQSMGGNKLTSVATPTTGTDAANKTYVDGLVAGLKWKASAKAATTAAGTLASDFEDGDTIDGVTLAEGDRILVKDQADGTENGVYVVAASGAPTRATDADAGAELVNAAVFVEQGTVNADKAFVCTNNTITLGATSVTFTGFASVVGALVAANNLSDLASASTARTNLGLAIGVNVQAYDADLAAIAGLTSAADKGIYFTGSGTAAVYDLTAFGRSLGGAADAAAARTLLEVTGGTNVTRETPSGTINGSNTDFTLANVPVAGTEHVYVNGLLMDAGAGNDYTIADDVITFLTGAIPQSGDKIRVSYTY